MRLNELRDCFKHSALESFTRDIRSRLCHKHPEVRPAAPAIAAAAATLFALLAYGQSLPELSPALPAGHVAPAPPGPCTCNEDRGGLPALHSRYRYRRRRRRVFPLQLKRPPSRAAAAREAEGYRVGRGHGASGVAH